MKNLSTHGNVALSQKGGTWFAQGNKDEKLEKGSRSRRSDSEDLSKTAHCDDRGWTMAQQLCHKLQQLIGKPLALGDGTPVPGMKGVEDNARCERQESVAMNDEVAMQLHQVLNAPSLGSHVRRHCASGPSVCSDSARNSKKKSCNGWSQDDSGSLSSDDDCSCMLEGKPVA